MRRFIRHNTSFGLIREFCFQACNLPWLASICWTILFPLLSVQSLFHLQEWQYATLAHSLPYICVPSKALWLMYELCEESNNFWVPRYYTKTYSCSLYLLHGIAVPSPPDKDDVPDIQYISIAIIHEIPADVWKLRNYWRTLSLHVNTDALFLNSRLSV